MINGKICSSHNYNSFFNSNKNTENSMKINSDADIYFLKKEIYCVYRETGSKKWIKRV